MSDNGNDGKDSQSFWKYLEAKGHRFDYKTYDFLYDHNGPCPQVGRDHPFGQAPEVLNIPQEEWDDWNTYVYDYYTNRGVSFAFALADFSFGHLLETSFAGYAEIADDEFALLLGEGLYSKFLCPLEKYPAERKARWGTLNGQREYFVSDYSCMRVITEPWEGEYVAPTVVLLSRPKGNYTTRESYDAGPGKTVYTVEAIDLFFWDKDKKPPTWTPLERPLTPTDGDKWWIAKYFVLQGAIHRINLIDHTEVHFPSDAINALTKTVLPKRNLVFQLLIPHFWLQLPVNNSVLEGDRSLIARETWYPWSPFVAKGAQVRKLLPFGWYGSKYYAKEDPYFETENPSYPAYEFELEPAAIPSRYGRFFADYFTAIKTFVTKIVKEIPPVDKLNNNTDWLEIQDWATQIASWLPGFPDWRDLLGSNQAREKLTNALSMIILNNSVMHSADHGTLHQIMNTKPVPYILRTPPPSKMDYTKPTGTVGTFLCQLYKARKISKELYEKITGYQYWGFIKGTKFLPLAYPNDLMSERMTDLLFYLPHNCSLLIDCDYQFTQKGQKRLTDEIAEAAKKAQYAAGHQYELKSLPLDPVENRLYNKIDELQRQLLEPPALSPPLPPPRKAPPPPVPRYPTGIGERLQQAVYKFQEDLRKVNGNYQKEIETLGFPMVEAPFLPPAVGTTPVPPGNLRLDPSNLPPVSRENNQDPPFDGQARREEIMRTRCIGAGIQY